MTRLAGFCMGLGALIILAAIPADVSAGWQLGRGGSSYSPLHYWLPSLYTCRAYHRPVNYIDVAEYDLGATDSIHGGNCAPSSQKMLPPAKAEALPPPKKESGKN
jgi:hypothetical protein